MRHLLNTLFVMTENSYLALENENVVVKQEEEVLGRIPLLTLENILYFGKLQVQIEHRYNQETLSIA